MNEPKLIEMLHSEIGKLDDREVRAFRAELQKELPRAIRKAARAAQKAKATAAG